MNRREPRVPWHESENPSRVVRGASWRIGAWIVGVMVFFGLIGAGIWGFKVATSGIKGEGDKTRIVNDGKNQIASQEAFEALFAQIQAYDRNLDQAAKDKAEHPGDAFFATNYSGLVKTCNDAVFQYNADARKISKSKWMSADLPYEIDLNNPLTDCKETFR